MKKVLVVSILLLLTVLTLVACSNENGEEQASTNEVNIDAENISFPLDETVTLDIMTSSSPIAPEDPNDKLIYQRLEEKTNVHVEWRNHVGEAFAEKRNLAIASGDLPDAITNAAYSDYELLELAEDGAIIPLNDLIDNHMPNLQKVLEKAPHYRSMMTAPDGNIYSLPWIEELGQGKESIHSVDAFSWINVEWLEEVGLDMPETTEELKEALIAFKENDLAGNGPTIPMSFIINHGGEDPHSLFGSFGLGDNWDHKIVTNDGEVVLSVAQDGWKEGVKYLHELYSLGLIDVDAFTQDWPTYLAKGKEGQYGMYFTWDKANITGMNDTYKLLPPLEGPDGHINATRQNGWGFDRNRFVITMDAENPVLVAKWIDQFYDPHLSVQANWGTYGDTEQQNIFEFDEENQMLRHLPLEGTAPVELREKTSVGGPLAILDSYYGNITTKPDDAAWRLDLMKEVMVPHMKQENIYPVVFFKKEELDRISSIEADLYPYIKQMRAKFIKDGQVEDTWDEFLAELNRLGLQEWLEIQQSGYDRATQ